MVRTFWAAVAFCILTAGAEAGTGTQTGTQLEAAITRQVRQLSQRVSNLLEYLYSGPTLNLRGEAVFREYLDRLGQAARDVDAATHQRPVDLPLMRTMTSRLSSKISDVEGWARQQVVAAHHPEVGRQLVNIRRLTQQLADTLLSGAPDTTSPPCSCPCCPHGL